MCESAKMICERLDTEEWIKNSIKCNGDTKMSSEQRDQKQQQENNNENWNQPNPLSLSKTILRPNIFCPWVKQFCHKVCFTVSVLKNPILGKGSYLLQETVEMGKYDYIPTNNACIPSLRAVFLSFPSKCLFQYVHLWKPIIIVQDYSVNKLG